MSKSPTSIQPVSIRHEYEKHGAHTYYKECGHNYRNPHEQQIQVGLPQALKLWKLKPQKVIDLACGSGEISLIIYQLWPMTEIIGIDPYTKKAYEDRTGRECLSLSFEDISQSNFKVDLKCDLIICSYALHLLDTSYLWQLLTVLAQFTSQLIIITPHKNPNIQTKWGWTLIDEQRFINCHQRYRLYQSNSTLDDIETSADISRNGSLE
jgi:SAM-dependent methyltransferase